MKSHALFQRLVRHALVNAHGERNLIARLLRQPGVTVTHRRMLIQMMLIEVELYKMSAHLNVATTKSLTMRTKALRAAIDFVKRPLPHESLARTYLVGHVERFARDIDREVQAAAGLAGMRARVV